MDCEHINITIFKLLCKKSKENSSICIYIASCSTSWPSDVEGHSEVQRIIPLSVRSMGNEECPSTSTGCNAVDRLQPKNGKSEQECSAKKVCKAIA